VPPVTPLDLALASQTAYHESDISRKGVELTIRRHDKTVVIAFRGTEFDGRDILRDIKLWPWRDSRIGWCHYGFLMGAREVYPEILTRLNIWDPRAIYLTGHSLGAAMATITAALLTWEFPASVLHLVTFGSPRAGRSLEQHLVGVDERRTVFGRDAVTAVPSPMFYRHVGGPVRLGAPTDDMLFDHRLANYVEAERTKQKEF
jgi:triacylglycerol lipase